MNLKAVLEGILFIVGDEGTSIEEMVRVLGVNDEEVKKLLVELKKANMEACAEVGKLIALTIKDFEGNCDVETRAKIYCYIAMCGLLWSNWCEYKQMLGVEFGEYSLRQYRYAKEYFRYAKELIGGKYGIE